MKLLFSLFIALLISYLTIIFIPVSSCIPIWLVIGIVGGVSFNVVYEVWPR